MESMDKKDSKMIQGNHYNYLRMELLRKSNDNIFSNNKK